MIDCLREAGYTFEHPAHLNESDIDTLMVIEEEAFPVDHYTRAQLLEEYEQDPGLFIVARNRVCNPVGYVSGAIDTEVGIVMSVAVKRDVRGFGIGSGLVGLMTDYLKSKGAQRLEAYARVDNVVSALVLGRFGFVVVDRVEDYYKDNSPALHFRARV
jgi:[ribosomal protein S18]-alanine N-acetyltransferase